MDRVIKFRGKSIETGKWVYGDLIHMYLQNPTIQEIKPARGGVATYITWKVDPETVGQFTGAFDCDGKEIYEGDIVQQTNTKKLFIIKKSTEKSAFVAEKLENPFVLKNITLTNDSKRQMRKVIGNIHDNPELWGGGNDD